uniref:Uncharacterized protein n=1 Tax=Anguilla anguilla TaxID=7936 RepID=A0A0E9RFF7_ANGAN
MGGGRLKFTTRRHTNGPCSDMPTPPHNPATLPDLV